MNHLQQEGGKGLVEWKLDFGKQDVAQIELLFQCKMWKKMGNVRADNCRSVRSHLSKDEEHFEHFYDNHPTLLSPNPPAELPRSSFCQAYINRHHSADKPHLTSHSRTLSDRSSLMPAEPTQSTQQQPANDLFSIMRSQVVHRKHTIEAQNGAGVSDYTFALMEKQLKMYRNKWRDAKQKLHNLKKKQLELKNEVASELSNWKKAVENAVGELKNHTLVKREAVVVGALEAVKEFRNGQEKLEKERDAILRKFNTSLERLI